MQLRYRSELFATDGATVHEGGPAGGEPAHHRTGADTGEDTAVITNV